VDKATVLPCVKWLENSPKTLFAEIMPVFGAATITAEYDQG
jgi:hypothetical protein